MRSAPLLPKKKLLDADVSCLPFGPFIFLVLAETFAALFLHDDDVGGAPSWKEP